MYLAATRLVRSAQKLCVGFLYLPAAAGVERSKELVTVFPAAAAAAEAAAASSRGLHCLRTVSISAYLNYFLVCCFVHGYNNHDRRDEYNIPIVRT